MSFLSLMLFLKFHHAVWGLTARHVAPLPSLDGEPLAPSSSASPIPPSARTLYGVRPMANPTAPTWFTLVRSLRWLDPRRLRFLSYLRSGAVHLPAFIAPMSSCYFWGRPPASTAVPRQAFLAHSPLRPRFHYPPLYSDHGRSFSVDPGVEVSTFIQFVGTFKVPTKFSRHLAYEFPRPGLNHIKSPLPSRRLRTSAPPLPIFSSLEF